MWRTRRTTLQLNWPLGYMILRQTLSFLIHFAYYSTGQVRENETSRTLGLRLKASFRIPDVENRSFIEHIHDLLSVWMTTSKSTETSSANRPSFLHFLPEQSMYLPNPSGLDMDKFINRNYPTTKTLRRSSKLLRFNNDLSFTSNFCGSWISSNISLLSWSFALCKELISRVYSSVAKKTLCWSLDLPANISGKKNERSIQISNQGDQKRNTRSGLSFQYLLFHCVADW